MKFHPTEKEDLEIADENGDLIEGLAESALERFSPQLLGLGDIGQESTPTSVVCAIIDLEGFTRFCSQMDPSLCIPAFLSDYLGWFYKSIKDLSVHEKTANGSKMYLRLPFYTKFLGDGLLILWDADNMSEAALDNVIIIMESICRGYSSDLLPILENKFSYVPRRLRCGIARGIVYSVGNGEDYVGPCINLAARLQKHDGHTFAFCSRGFPLKTKEIEGIYTRIKTAIRGIGEEEIVYVRKSERPNLENIKGPEKRKK